MPFCLAIISGLIVCWIIFFIHVFLAMIVLSDVQQPVDGVRISQPQVQIYFDSEAGGEGTLTVSERSVTWVNRQTQKGISLTYPSIILHAVSTDLSSFPHECIYVLVDCSKAERRKRRMIPLYTAAEAEHVNDLNMANEELNEDAEDDSSEDAPNVAIRFVPTDNSVLQTIYDQMSQCQELNPDEDDMSDEEGAEMGDIGEAEEMEMAMGVGGNGRWFTAENMADLGDGEFEMSEEGLANLQRMMGDHGGQNGHDDDNEHGDDTMED